MDEFLELLNTAPKSRHKKPKRKVPPVRVTLSDGRTQMVRASRITLSKRPPKKPRRKNWKSWYQGYLKSQHWRKLRLEILQRDKYRCQSPGCSSMKYLEVHHLTYVRVPGRELPEDLVTLCNNCHEEWHRLNTK